MTREERELRELLLQFGVNDTTRRFIGGKITAALRAERERCAKVADETCERLLTLPPSPGDKPRQLCKTAAAIRRMR